MSSADQAAELRARADTLEAMGELESDLLTAKEAYADNPTSETRAAKQRAAEALRTARVRVRADEVVIGGDAYLSETEG
jgi:hypothetical protein